jgi:replicative DNA helicase
MDKEIIREQSNRRRNLENSFTTSMGKLPPQNIELEQSILGSIIDDHNFMIDVADLLKPQHFYMDSNQKIYEAVYNLYNTKSPIDLMTVVAELKRLGQLENVGGAYYITELTSKGMRSGTNIDYHSKIIIQKFMQREMIRISTQTISDSYDDTTDVFDIIEKNQNSVFLTLSDTHQKNGNDISDLIDSSLEELKKPPINGLTGVGTGFFELDKITSGWQKSDLIIVAARPAMGKTAFVLKCARNAAVKFNKPTVFFSLEMSSLQLTYRLLADECNILLDKILKRNVTAEEITSMEEKLIELKKSKIIIDDSPSLNIFEFRAKCRRLKQKQNIGLIIVDYLQLMNGGDNKNNNRDAEIGLISRGLKQVAKELNIPVIALSQLSRTVETRAVKRPMLSDLRESGNIEQDADQVYFLYRPEYYGVLGQGGESLIGLCELIMAKNRHGATDTIKLDFNGSKMRFKDWFDYKKHKKSVEANKTLEIPNIDYSAKTINDDDEPPF